MIHYNCNTGDVQNLCKLIMAGMGEKEELQESFAL